MTDGRVELSGAFGTPEKWHALWSSLADPGCTTQHLRIYHTTGDQVAGTAAALAANDSVRVLEVADLDAQGAAALGAALRVGGRPAGRPAAAPRT
jgi:hypothetical protein